MKYLVFMAAVFLVSSLSGCDNLFKSNKMNTDTINNGATPNGSNGTEMPEIKFEKEVYEFGTIEQNEVISFSFKFTNTGKADLVINNCSASCGCTVPNWPKNPIRPGESGYIDVEFDSKGKQNDITKEVTISTNCNPAVYKLKFHGFVKVPEKK